MAEDLTQYSRRIMFVKTSPTLIEIVQGDSIHAKWQQAWSEFYFIYQAPLAHSIRSSYRWATQGRTPDPAVVDDILAELFVSLTKGGIFSYDPSKAKLRTYLRTIAQRKVIDHLRKCPPSKQPLPLDELEIDLPDESEEEARSYARLVLAELLKLLQRSIPPRQFLILEKKHFHGESVADIANELEMKPEQVSRELYKAMSKLAELVKNNPSLKDEYRA